MRDWLTRSALVAAGGSLMLIASGYTPSPIVLIIAGALVIVGSAALAIMGLAEGKEKVFGPNRHKPESTFFANAVGALAPTAVGIALMVSSGYHSSHGGLLLIGGAFLLGSLIYWFRAAANYRKNKQKEIDG